MRQGLRFAEQRVRPTGWPAALQYTNNGGVMPGLLKGSKPVGVVEQVN